MKTIAITGATSGIGLATAEALLEKGHEIIFLVRNTKKAEKIIQKMKHSEGVSVIACDLADLSSVKMAAEQLKKQVSRLDVLINNAGGTFDKRRESKDGFEMHLAVNHLGHFLLVKLLWEYLEKHDTKIINLSSEAHRAAKPDFDDLNLEQSYSAIKGYGNAKLYNILFTKSLADQGFTAYAVHPGVINSNFGDTLPGPLKFMWGIAKPFMKSTQDGAATSIYLATHDLPKKQNGAYFKDKKTKSTTATANSVQNRNKLWEASEEMVKDYL